MSVKISKLKKNSIINVYAMRNQIDPEPEYQREGNLWSEYNKQLLIDSIITGYDVPKLYLQVLPKSDKPNSKRYAIIDGKQRLESIWQFIDNKFPLGKFNYPVKNPKKLTGMFYHELAQNYPKLVSIFNQYELPIMLVNTSDDIEGVIEEMFLRLNESVSINAAERRNAMGGNVMTIIKDLIKNPFFTESIKIKTNRYRHHEISIRLLFIEYKSTTNDGIIDTKRSYLDDFVKMFKTDPLPPNITDTVKKTLKQLHLIFKKNDSLLSSQARIPIYYLLVREAIDQDKSKLITREKIEKFVDDVKQNKYASLGSKKENPILSEYDRLTIQGTSDASSIKTRFDIIAKYFNIKSNRVYYPQTLLD